MAAPLSNPLSIPIPRLGAWRGVRPEALRWAMACGLTVFPLAAILHHVVFYRASCMLNAFGPDYTGATLTTWLARDPSLWLAMLIGLATFQFGNRYQGTRPLVVAFALAFLPLALWIWDIPFTGRVICHHLHDHRVLLAEGVPLRSRHLYMLSGVLFAVQLARLAWARRQGVPPAARQTPVSSASPAWEGERVRSAA